MKLTGKKALITGGNSGIGLATARLFIAEGAQVAITGRDQKTLDEAVAELGRNARGYRADVTVAEDRKRLFAALASDFGKLDIVFANAGISGRTPTGSTDEAVFENVIHTNLTAAFFTVNSAAPMLNDNGSIIFNGSVHNYLGQPGVAAYAATKGGVVSMARAIAADLAPRNIRVNVVAPGRPPIAQSRILSVSDREVEFSTKDKRLKRWVTIKRSGREFVGDLAEHVPDPYRHVNHYFGLLAPRAKNRTSTAVFTLVGQNKRPRPRRLSWRASRQKYFGVDPLIDSHGERMHWVRRQGPLYSTEIGV